MRSLLSHLALALAGVCLTCAELPYLPELGPGLIVYLLLVALAWRIGRRWMLRNWMANLLGLAIAGGATLWIWLRLSDSASWAREIELPGALIPYLGPILMALTLARLFRPQHREDFWVLQGLGLLQVGLGCVLASDTLFGVFLLAYLVTALCSLAAHERDSQGGEGDNPAPRRGWVSFAVRWALALGLLTWPLFLATPRVDGPEWQPLTRFRVEPARQQEAIVGFSDEINLNSASRLTPDYSVA